MDGLYAWVDGFEFSRPKRQIARDFSDAGGRFGGMRSRSSGF